MFRIETMYVTINKGSLLFSVILISLVVVLVFKNLRERVIKEIRAFLKSMFWNYFIQYVLVFYTPWIVETTT